MSDGPLSDINLRSNLADLVSLKTYQEEAQAGPCSGSGMALGEASKPSMPSSSHLAVLLIFSVDTFLSHDTGVLVLQLS